MEEPKFSLSREYQVKVLAFMLCDPKFCDTVKVAVAPEDFSDRVLQWFFLKMSKDEDGLTPATLKEELLKAADAKEIKEDQLDLFCDLYKDVIQPPVPAEQKHITRTLREFIKTQNTQRAFLESVELMEEGRWPEIIEKIQAAVTTGIDALEIGHNYFADYKKRITAAINEEAKKKLSTGIPALDEVTYGGIAQKQVGLIAGGTGRGKSLFLSWLTQAAIVRGKIVVYYTLEMPKEDIAARFDSLFCRIKPSEHRERAQEIMYKIGHQMAQYKDSLFIQEYNPGSITMAEISSHYRLLNANGIYPDLVCIDYLDLIKSQRAYNDSYSELDSVSKAICAFAKEYNTRVWTATQLNRSSYAVETPDESSMSGSMAKLFNVDMSIFMAQTNAEREDEEMRLLITKNRNGPAGKTIEIDTDYNYMKFYRERLNDESPSSDSKPV